MRSNILNAVVKTALVTGVLLGAGISSAATINLRAVSGTNTDADGATVWRFVCDAGNVEGTCVQTDEGAPTIRVPSEPLTINLANDLPIPVSIMIPGQFGDTTVSRTVDGRALSLAAETAASSAGTPGTNVYTWSNLNEGTYLFQSATVPQLQVPMGLFGALIVTGPDYPVVGQEAVLLFSEIDPIQNDRVHAAASAGPLTEACVSMADFLDPMTPSEGYPCTIDYSPTYYLVNGKAAPNLSGLSYDPLATEEANTVHLRMLNAGLRTHTPAFVNLEMSIFAEDGNIYPGQPLQQSGAMLAAGKTLDALMALPAVEHLTIAMNDRSPSFSDDNYPTGGARAALVVGDGSGPGTDALTGESTVEVIEDTPLEWDPPGGNGLRIVGGASHGTIETFDNDETLNFRYTPHDDFFGTDAFTYYQAGNAKTWYVTVNVLPVNDSPVGTEDAYSNTFGEGISVAAPGVLGNDVDVDGDALTATLNGDPVDENGVPIPNGDLTLGTDGSIEYTGTADVTFSYIARDGTVGDESAPIEVTLTSNPLSGIVLNVQEPNGTPVSGYRWLVQEDAGYAVNPADPAPFLEQQSLNFHKSYMPVIAQGCDGCTPDVDVDITDGDFPNLAAGDIDFNGNGVVDDMIDIAELALDPTKRYYVSVLPNDAASAPEEDGTGHGHTIGGTQIPALADATAGYPPITVIVNRHEIPTAQVSVYVFEDHVPTNGVPDASEPGLGGFTVTLEDAGGRYGMSGGPMSQDAFGAPLTNSLMGNPDYPDCPGSAPPGIIVSCPDGSVLVQNLPPGKYGVVVTPPADAQQWIQTSTIEGSPVIDAWVKAGEPTFFAEFGLPGPHVFVGYVDPARTVVPPDSNLPGDNTITGRVTLLHDPRPPAAPGTSDSGSYVGLSHTSAWIGLNDGAGDGANVATVQADDKGNFSIEGIPNGDYQLVIWDTYLDQIIAFQSVTLTGAGATVGNVPVNNWFARVENNVFLDANGNGVWDGRGDNVEEPGIPEQAVNLRWRDGTMNQSFPTDTGGFVPFDEVFPFFHWQLLEVDYTRFKPTGMTATVDAGGTVDPDGDFAGLLRSTYPADTVQVADGDGAWGAASTRRTELGSTVLVQAFQGFPGQTSVIDWGKVPYKPGENGGISGIVSYGSTRGEADPRLTVMDPWEPGVPGVTVNLYREVPGDVAGETKLALIQSVETDSWDASLPTGCEGEVENGKGDAFVDGALGGDDSRCYDGWRNWNQVRPGVFDGGYAFNDIPPGNYVVEVVPPPGYEIYKEEDVNVGFGDFYGNPPGTGFEPVSVILPNGALVYEIPDGPTVESVGLIPGLAQPECVGPTRIVPEQLSLFPADAAPFAGAIRPLCTRKAVLLSDQGQSAADFHLLTQTPVAAQFTGLITDDIAAQTDPASPGFGEKFSPSYLPIAIRDFTGREVYRGYSDAFGHYNGVLPSTYTANAPIPSGYAPAMMSACLNDGGNGPSLDPLVNPNYGGACYTMQFMPGTTTYLDTPVLPQAAFAAGYNSPDCAAPQGTPVIAEVLPQSGGGGNFGPWIDSTAKGAGNHRLRILAAGGGTLEVPNPAYEGPLAPAPYNQPLISRDVGFGDAKGAVTIGDLEFQGKDIQKWKSDEITVELPADVEIVGQLVVTRGDNGNRSVNAVTVTQSDETPIRVGPGQSIQAAIDGAAPGALILVAPGVYEESVVMWKPVRLQGAGSSTIINAVSRPTDKLEAWQNKVEGLVADNLVSLLPGQPTAGTPFAPGLLGSERGAGVTVLARGGPGSGCGSAAPGDGCFQIAGGERIAARIDGFTITGGASGGGIFVNGYAHGLEIANNSVTANSGAYHGGIRVGHPYLPLEGDGLFGFNNGIRIHNNAVTRNGATGEQSAGGGISLMTGTNGYRVESNFVCGNFAQGDGGGIAHLGLSNAGRIENNDILFNESSNPGLTQSGGGLFIAGEQPAPPTVPGDQPELLSRGAGNIIVNANRIQGNHAASGHGGGIRAERINGLDVVDATVNQRYRLLLDNNIVVNNVAGWSGGGVSLLDSARVIMRNNTIANNDTTATVGSLLPTPSDVSVAQPAGISSQQHSLVLAAALALTVDPQTFSSPIMINNIVWHNRAFNYDGTQAVRLQPALAPTAVGDCATGANYIDLGVLGGAGQLDPRRSILTDTADYHGSNIDGDPLFVGEYCNGGRKLSVAGPMEANAAQGEGGNFVTVRYGALTQAWPANAEPWNYHIGEGSAAEDTAAGGPGTDFDGDARPQGAAADRGADELIP